MTDKFRATDNEYLPVPVYQKDTTTGTKTLVTSGLEFSVVPNGQNEGTFTPAVTRGNTAGFQVSGLTAGVWRIWARISASGDAVILDCGTIIVV